MNQSAREELLLRMKKVVLLKKIRYELTESSTGFVNLGVVV
jgi:hypothetical protein